MSSKIARALFGAITALIWSVGPAAAQDIIEGSEELRFDRTEAWAMKYFASVGIFTGFGVPPALEPGANCARVRGRLDSFGERRQASCRFQRDETRGSQ